MNSKINHNVIFQELGVLDYQSAWDYQEKLLKSNIDIKINNRQLQPEDTTETENHLLFVEHPHVYTLGKSGHEENMLANNDMLKEIDATYVKQTVAETLLIMAMARL